MNYHTLATNADDEINNSVQTTTQKGPKNVQLEKTGGKPRQPLRRSLSAQHRAIKVSFIKAICFIFLIVENVKYYIYIYI